MGPKRENVKISSAWIRPKWAYKQQTHIFPTYFACPKEALARQESEPKRQRNDRSEKRSSKKALPDPFRGPRIKIFLQNVLGRSSKLCFLCGRGAHFQTNYEKSGRKMKNGAKRR